jgi:RND superfamily putative drug exporter
MASRLYQLGRFSYRRRRLVAVLWVALLIALGISASTLSGAYSSQFAIPGTESQQAIDTLTTRFPQAGLAFASANIVVAAPKGERVESPDNKAALEAVLAAVRRAPHVTDVLDPFTSRSISKNGRIAVARATYDILPLDVTSEQQKALFATEKPGTAAGLQVEYSGTAAQVKPEQGGLKELLGIAVAALVLLAMFGSFAAAGLPLLTAFLGVGIGAAAITTLTGFVTLSNTTPVLGLMLGLAVGIDYALFIMSRYRDELLKGRDGEEAAGRAVATAGSAVVFAGLTVIIALVGMLTVDIPFLSYMGLGAAATVIIAVLVAVTLLPAMLGFTGRKVLGRRKGESTSKTLPAGDPGAVAQDRAAGRGVAVPEGHQPAGVRPAVRGVRPRLQRAAGRRGRGLQRDQQGHRQAGRRDRPHGPDRHRRCRLGGTSDPQPGGGHVPAVGRRTRQPRE